MSSPANVLVCFRIFLLFGLATLSLQNISAQQPELKVQTGHIQEHTNALALSPDNKLLATGSWDGVVLWDAVSGRQLRSFRGSSIKSLAFSPNGQFLASGTDSGVNVWKAETGEPVLNLDVKKVVPTVRFTDNEHLIGCEGYTQFDLGVQRLANLCDAVTIWLVPSGQKDRDSSFGQLSYDKGMLVLAATEVENVSWGVPELEDRSLLSYALTQSPNDEGLFELRKWMRQAVRQVPALYRRFIQRESDSAAGFGRQQQVPLLFDFMRNTGN